MAHSVSTVRTPHSTHFADDLLRASPDSLNFIRGKPVHTVIQAEDACASPHRDAAKIRHGNCTKLSPTSTSPTEFLVRSRKGEYRRYSWPPGHPRLVPQADSKGQFAVKMPGKDVAAAVLATRKEAGTAAPTPAALWQKLQETRSPPHKDPLAASKRIMPPEKRTFIPLVIPPIEEEPSAPQDLSEAGAPVPEKPSYIAALQRADLQRESALAMGEGSHSMGDPTKHPVSK